ncbi:unnamed protein product [Urochloa humidicola]
MCLVSRLMDLILLLNLSWDRPHLDAKLVQGFMLQFDWLNLTVKRCLSCAMTSPFEIAGVQDCGCQC